MICVLSPLSLSKGQGSRLWLTLMQVPVWPRSSHLSLPDSMCKVLFVGVLFYVLLC